METRVRRYHDHKCPGCGESIGCDFICCDKCDADDFLPVVPFITNKKWREVNAEHAALTARLTVLAGARERFASLLDCLEPRLVAIVANRTGDIGPCTQEPDGCSECLARECLAAVATARTALGAERA